MNLRTLLGATLLLAATGCAFTNIKIPLDTNLDNTQLGSKVGEASSESVLWLVAWGDAGIQAAAAQGGLTTITHADRKIYNILFGLYTRETTVVYGD